MPSPQPSEYPTFLFADLAGYTALTEAMGDEQAADLAADFSAEARPLLAEHRAREIKTIGDALMLHAADAADAVRLGLRLATEVGARHNFPAVRVGMHTGPAVERDGDWFGAAVNLAARVSGVARGGEALLTQATAEVAGPIDTIELADRGSHELRNVAEPVRLYAALACDACDPAAELPIDPVCRMAVDPGRCAGTLQHAGREYHFCSLECVSRFASAPDRYAAA